MSFHNKIISVISLIKRSANNPPFAQFATVFTNAIVDKVPVEPGFTQKKKILSPPVAVNIHVDERVRKHLHLANGHRKLRFLVSTKQIEDLSVASFREMIGGRVSALSNLPYRLRYKEHPSKISYQTLQTDQEFQQLLHTSLQQKSSISLHLQALPGIFPLTSNLSDSQVLPDPMDSLTYTMVSFFSFHQISDPKWVQEELFSLWKPLQVLGRVYIAKEGINAQMAIPTNVFNYFQEKTKELPYFQESKFNTDPEMSREEYEKFKPFRNLHIRLRNQIVADGLEDELSFETTQPVADSSSIDSSLDWRKSGKELSPLDWHIALDQIGRNKADSTTSLPASEKQNITILDCRNSYETDVGIFESAIPLNTTFFRESWKALDEILENTPKDQPIYTYCTGGIRCVKINAYLEQKLGFNNTHRLQGGIIAYRRELERLKQQSQQHVGNVDSVTDLPLKSKFHGTNYVFDERIGERITEEVLTFCELCGSSCDTFNNCLCCNVRFIQCPSCSSKYHKFCSKACQKEQDLGQANQKVQELLELRRPTNFLQLDEKSKSSSIKLSSLGASSQSLLKHLRSIRREIETNETNTKTESSPFPTELHAFHDNSLSHLLSSYSEKYSVKEPPLLQQLRKETESVFSSTANRMLSGPSQGALLSFLATISNAKSILELGTFTGYSALCFAIPFHQFSNNKQTESQEQSINREIYTCEIDKKSIEIAKRYFYDHPFTASKIFLHSGKANELLEIVRRDQKTFDLVFIDSDKKEYLHYLKELLGENNISNEASNYKYLNDNALIVIDNTLWKGLVLKQDDSFAQKIAYLEPSNDRYEKIAKKMHELNSYVSNHPNLRPLLLPIRDGLTIMQYYKD